MTEGRGVLRAILRFVGFEVPHELEFKPGPDAIRDGGRYDHFADGMMVAEAVEDAENLENFVVEVQLSEDPTKRYTWPLYVVVSRNRLRRRTTLIVFTDSDAVAQWASEPIEIGRGMVMRPFVIGPRQIPVDLPRDKALEIPALAVLVVVAHGRGPDAHRIGQLAFEAIRPLLARDRSQAMLYLDVIFAYLDGAVLEQIVEDEMSVLDFEPISPYFKRLRTQGMMQMLTRLLDRRKLVLTEEQRKAMAVCDDEQQLQQWFDRAVDAQTSADVFDA